MKFLLKAVAPILFWAIAGFAFSQTGNLSGTVMDEHGEPVPFTTVKLEENPKFITQTDDNGKFGFKDVPAGSYTLVVTPFDQPETKTPVEVKAGETTELDVKTVENSNVVVVEYVVDKGTDVATIEEVQKSTEIVTAVSQEQMQKSQDNNAAQVMARIPGVTIIDGRFVIVRGLPQRYNNVMINNIIVPSTEVDSRTFSFDLIPTSMLERILVYKSGAADLPGDFAGGMVKLYTRNPADVKQFNVQFRMGYRSGTTFGTFRHSENSGTDIFGYDNSFRVLPSSFPTDNLNTVPVGIRLTNTIRDLNNSWTNSERTAGPDLRFNLSYSNYVKIKNKITIANTTGLSYSKSSQVYDINLFRYNNFDPALGKSQSQFEFKDQLNQRDVRVGVLFNWNVAVGKAHNFHINNLYNQLGTTEDMFRTGIDFRPGAGTDVQNYSYRFQSRGIYMGSVGGTHKLFAWGGDKEGYRTEVTWAAGYSSVVRKEPDWRRIKTNRPTGTDDPYTFVFNSSPDPSIAGRFWSELTERITSFNLGVEHKLTEGKKVDVSVLAGTYFENKDREFTARWMSYKSAPSSSPSFIGDIAQLPFDQIFADANINSQTGLTLEEGTNPQDKYTAQNTLLAYYGGANFKLFGFTVSGGVRMENNIQKLQSLTTAGPVDVNNPINSTLPFANVSYGFIPDKLQLRAAYSKTVNRPDFRELAPFNFYDFSTESDVVGNPLLKVANIQNLESRLEWYPGPGEMIAVGAFYKEFTNPIETYFIQGANNPIFTFNNATKATAVGAEAEVRKRIFGIYDDKGLANHEFSLFFNGSIIQSRVDLGETTVNQDRFRPLQGQSPYTINTGIYYNSDRYKLNISLLYNTYGKRIFTVGDDNFPTMYEMPRQLIDLTIRKSVNRWIDFNFGVSDLFNAKFKIVQDSDRDGDIGDKDEEIMSFRRGAYYLIGFTFKLSEISDK